MVKYLIIVTARTDSSRLPGKILMKIKGIPIIKIIVDRLKKSKLKSKIVVATTNLPSDDYLVYLLKKNKINFFRGEENNVIKRVLDAAKLYDGKNIILITGDCPLVDFKLIDKFANIYEETNVDFVTNANIRSYPDGMDVQIFKYSCLKKFYKKIKKKEEFEHVTLSMRRNISKNKIINLIAEKKLYYPDLGLTLDEREDFILIKKIYEHFWKKKKKYFDIYEIMVFLKKNKKLMLINSKVNRKGDT